MQPHRFTPALVLLPTLIACGASSTPAPTTVAHSGPADDVATPDDSAHQPLTKTELARQVLETVRANDFERFSTYLATPAELAAEAPEESAERVAEVHARIMAYNRMFFAEAYERGERLGIVWSEVTFVEAQQSGRESRRTSTSSSTTPVSPSR